MFYWRYGELPLSALFSLLSMDPSFSAKWHRSGWPQRGEEQAAISGIFFDVELLLILSILASGPFST